MGLLTRENTKSTQTGHDAIEKKRTRGGGAGALIEKIQSRCFYGLRWLVGTDINK